MICSHRKENNRASSLLRKFVRSEAGMTLPTLAFSFMAIMGFAGIAVDTARVQMVQAKLQFSLDAAGLAAGSTVNTANIHSEASKYLNSNFNGYMGAILEANSPTVVVENNNTEFVLSATATVPTTFMGLFGVDNVTLATSTRITREITGIELVFALDNTGSMTSTAGGGVTKISALKTAATSLIENLFSNADAVNDGKVWVGMVPFSHMVNIGLSHQAWLGNVDPVINANWNGCVDARQKGYDVTDDVPDQDYEFTLFNLRSYNKCVTNPPAAEVCSVSAECAPSSYFAPYVTCTYTGPYTYVSPLPPVPYGKYEQPQDCPSAVTPMTNDKGALLSSVGAMVARGNTVINEGLVWAWRMISPRWRGYWGGTMDANNLPLDYHHDGMIKVVVLLTDGKNTMSASNQGAYWMVKNGWTGFTTVFAAQSALDNKTLQICNAMKEQGIYVYTIGLGQTYDINIPLLQSCATAPNYAFVSPTTGELQNVFNAIGDSLANLRISQ